MSKTIKEWLETIEDPEIRKKALGNMDSDDEDYPRNSLPEAMVSAFLWKDSPEGYKYWKKAYNSIMITVLPSASTLKENQRDLYLQTLKDIDSALEDGVKVIRKGSPMHMGIKKLIKDSND